MEKHNKTLAKIISLKYQLQRGMKKLNYLVDQILYQILKIIPIKSLKNMKQ